LERLIKSNLIKKVILYGIQKENHKTDKDLYNQDLNYLIQESNINFDELKNNKKNHHNNNDNEIIGKFIPQSFKDRQKFKNIIEIKSEDILT
jgi:hypothetical protein